jgi:hypothetical protein
VTIISTVEQLETTNGRPNEACTVKVADRITRIAGRGSAAAPANRRAAGCFARPHRNHDLTTQRSPHFRRVPDAISSYPDPEVGRVGVLQFAGRLSLGAQAR